jgi:hypothetical protein
MKQVYLLFGTPKDIGCDRILAVYASYEAAQADFQSWMAAEEYNQNPQFDGLYILPFTVHDHPMGVKL